MSDPNQYQLMARRKAEMLDALLRRTAVFEADVDVEINGADFVEFFAEWRRDVTAAISELEAAYESQ